MEQDSPVSRVERTLWTVWSFLSGIVNRLLRPETANNISDDTQQGSSADCGIADNGLADSGLVDSGLADSGLADSGLADSSLAEGEARGKVVDEEQLFAKASLLSSSRPVVAWELCGTEVDSRPGETQLSRDDESGASEEDEEIGGDQIVQETEEDADAGLLNIEDGRASDDGEGVDGDQEADSWGQDEKPKHDESEEHLNNGELSHTDEAMSEEKVESGRKSSVEEETVTMIPCDDQKIGDTMKEIQVDEDDQEMDLRDEELLEVEDAEVRTVLSPEEEERVEITEEDKGLRCEEEDVTELTSENQEIESKECPKDQVQLLVCEEMEEDRDREDTGVTSTQVETEMAFDKSHSASDDEVIDADEERVAQEEVECGEDVLDLSEKLEDVSEEEQEDDEVQFSGSEKLLDADRDVEEDPGFTSPRVDLEMGKDKSDTELTEAGQVHVMSCRSDPEEDVEMMEEMEEGALGEEQRGTEAANVYMIEKVSEMEGKAGEQEVEDVLSDVRKNDVAEDLQVRDRTTGMEEVEKESLVTRMDENVSVNDTFEEAKEEDDDMGIARVTTSVTVNPVDEPEQEDRVESATAPQGTREGRPVAPQQSSPTCEETQEGVPGYNNEPRPDANTTQKFLEVGDSADAESSRLPEEVERKETESLENRDQELGGVYMALEERMESTEDFDNSFGFVRLSKEAEKLAEVEESHLLFAEDSGNLLFDSMKTGIEQPVKEFGCSIDETTRESQDDSKALLVDFETDKMLLDLEGDQPEQEAFTDERFLESKEQKIDSIQSFLEDITGLRFESDLTECTSFLQGAVEIEDAGTSEEGTDCEVEVVEVEEAAEDAKWNEEATETIKPEAEKVDALIAGGNEKENLLILESEGEHHQAAEESMATEQQPGQDFSPEFVKTSEDSVSESQDVIEEEILDLWIETLSEEEEKHEPGPQTEAQMEKSNEEQDEMLLVQIEKDTEQLPEVNTGESELVSDTEMSLSTAESGFSDQSLSENSETHLLKTTSSGSIHGLCDMTTNRPQSEEAPQYDPGSQDTSMEIKMEAMGSFSKEEKLDSGQTEWLRQEMEQSQEEIADDEEDGSLEEIADEVGGKGAEEDDVKTLIETLIEDQKTKMEEEHHSSDELQQTEPAARSRSGSEVSSEEDYKWTGSDSKGGLCIKPDEELARLEKLQPAWSEDVDQFEVNTTALDLTAQKSRIAVKNPRVRPPKDPRSLLHMPSLDPTPPPAASHPPARLPTGVPLGGMGMGIKLPGLGAGFPVLKKVRQVKRDEESADTQPQEPETKVEEKSETIIQEEEQHKPKWMPPRHPGFGNPLMSELKNKLKKTTKE